LVTGVRTNIKVKMEGKYMRLSKQKFSSNVVEKCLKQSSTHWRSIIIRELTAQPSVSELLRDRYGNYVLQTALSVATPQQVTTPHYNTLVFFDERCVLTNWVGVALPQIGARNIEINITPLTIIARECSYEMEKDVKESVINANTTTSRITGS
jgi:hypothetical protein